MAGKILIIKVGSTLEGLIPCRGDFEDWVISGMGIAGESVRVVKACEGEPLPPYDGVSGIVIPGSHDMVTERRPWSEAIAEWLPGAVEGGIPILGICYGHQLLALAMGGEVGDNPKGMEFGTVEILLQEAALEDTLFRGMTGPVPVHVCHTQSVLRLPPGARRLASSAADPNQAFVLGECAWGVQFHPEFDARITMEYIRHFGRELKEQGRDPLALMDQCRETPVGSGVLGRFAEILKERDRD